ncbi:MAG: glycosyltransferase [Chloroflexota bacterium]|nr:glycosyltransferase [Chloroflexota bacterium]
MTPSGDPARVDVLLGVGYDPDPRVRRETQALDAAGYAVRILAWDRDGTRPASERDGMVSVERIAIRSSWGRGPSQVLFFAILAARYLRSVRRRRPEVLHAVDLPMLAIAVLIAPFAGRPSIVYDAFELYAVMVSRRMPKPVVAVIDRLERWLPRYATVVITPGEIRQRYLRARGIDSVVVANWIDPPSPGVQRDEARRELGIPSDRFVIVYAGSLHPARDLDSLIEHARRVPTDLIVIAGRGEDEERLRGLADGVPNVRMLGWLRDPTALIAAADVLYYALRQDHPYAPWAAPNNLYVAIAQAVPLVYRPQGEQSIVGERYLIGRTFTDAESLDRAIDELRDEGTNAVVRRSLRDLQNQFAWERAASALLAAYPRKGKDARSASAKGP